MNEDRVLQEVDKTLAVLDTAPRAKPNPFFVTRLLSRMQAEEVTRGALASPMHRRVFLAAAGCVLLVLINIFSLLHLSTRTAQIQQEQTLASFAQEFNLTRYNY